MFGVAAIAYVASLLWTRPAAFADTGPLFQTIGGVFVVAYGFLIVSGLLLMLGRMSGRILLIFSLILELVLFWLPHLYYVRARPHVFSNVILLQGGMVFQVLTLFPVWAIIILSRESRLLRPANDAMRLLRRQRTARAGSIDFLLDAFRFVIVFMAVQSLADLLLRWLYDPSPLWTRDLTLPLWTRDLTFGIAVLVAIGNGFLLRRARYAKLRRRWTACVRSGFCPVCGYSLRGLVTSVCPECGTPITDNPA